MTEAWLRPLAQGIFWIVAMTLVMRWLAHGRRRPRPAADAKRMAHPLGILITGIVGTVFFIAVAIAATIWPDDDMTVLPVLLFASLVVLSASLIADYYFARHEVTDEGMDFGHMSGKRVSFRWTEVKYIPFA